MKVLVFDNYDSFTYNLVQIVEQILGEKVDVFRNNEIPLEDINQYDKIILSPGPGIPEEAGILLEHIFLSLLIKFPLLREFQVLEKG